MKKQIKIKMSYKYWNKLAMIDKPYAYDFKKEIAYNKAAYKEMLKDRNNVKT